MQKFREKASGRTYKAAPFVELGNVITHGADAYDDCDGWIVWKDNCFVGFPTVRFEYLFEPIVEVNERGSD